MTKPKKTKMGEKELGRKLEGAIQALESPKAARRTVVMKQEPPAKTNAPDELSGIWTDEIAAIFKGLQPKQRDFIIEYIKCGVGAEAYRRVYNPLASDPLAAASASQILSNINISSILSQFVTNKTEALFLVQKVYADAMYTATKPIFGKDDLGQPILVMEQPDHAIRVKAAEASAKLHGLNQPTEVKQSIDLVSKVIQVELPKKLNG